MMEFVNDDHAALSWDQAAQLVADGDAAMTIMGDWAQGYFTSIGLKVNEDYGWAPSPGTGGAFMMLSDSFGLPQGAPNRDNAVAWLTVAGSQEGQDAFNPLKGSIPARTDGDRTLYDAYLQAAMDDFASNEIAPRQMVGYTMLCIWPACAACLMSCARRRASMARASSRCTGASSCPCSGPSPSAR
jgi:glucose/mannose transport system substrate-binding protein